MNEKHGKCGLCIKSRDLEWSHIIPKLLSKKIRTQPAKVYTVENGQTQGRHLQDTQKERLLCGECEDKFEKLETYYSNHFKYPDYNSQLYDFLLSILWRVAESASRKMNEVERREFNSAIRWKEDARAYLDRSIAPTKFPKLYLFYLDKGSKYDFLVHMGTYHSDAHRRKVSLYHRFIDGHDQYNLWCEKDDSGGMNVIISIPHNINDYPTSIQDVFTIDNRQILVAASEDLITCVAIDGGDILAFKNYEITHGNGTIRDSAIPKEINTILSKSLIRVNRQTALNDKEKKEYDTKIKDFYEATADNICKCKDKS